MSQNTFCTAIKIFHAQGSRSRACSSRAAPQPEARISRPALRKYSSHQFPVRTPIHPCMPVTGAAQEVKGNILSLHPCSFLCVLRDAGLGWQGWLLQKALPEQSSTACLPSGPVLQGPCFCAHLEFGRFNKTHPERTEPCWNPLFVPTVKKVSGHWDYSISEL